MRQADMQRFLIIKTGGTFPEYAGERKDFEQWTARAMGLTPDGWDCVDVRAGETLPEPDGYAGSVITGSHDMVTDDLPWITATGAWICRAVEAAHPLLGICFGHQLMAQALGGEAGYHPDGPEIGTVPVTLTDQAGDDPLLAGLPKTFPAHVTHSQCALSLPPQAVLLARSAHEPHQAFRVGDNAWGVQFHPEFDADATRHYVRMQADKLLDLGLIPAAVEAAVTDTPESTGLLKKFADLCVKR